MPEGPEVETIRRGLEMNLIGQRFTGLEVIWQKSFVATGNVFRESVIGSRITEVTRRGKVLILSLDIDMTLLAHLKMTGQMVLLQANGERLAGGHPTASMASALPDSTTRVIFSFESGDRLFFNDQRKFGWIKLVRTKEVDSDPLVARMGPDVLSNVFTWEFLGAELARHGRAPVKAVILDQSIGAGIGNIYADESLHLARIHPARLAASLSPSEVKRLHKSIQIIISLGINHGGTSFAHFVNSLGGKGDYLAHARVFRREGKLCSICGATIIKIRVAGRGTHVCPKCQKLQLRVR